MAESALVGSPPATENDFWIARTITRFYNPTGDYSHVDPRNGSVGAPLRPDGYVYESEQSAIIGSAVFMVVYLILITSFRLVARACVKRLHFGWDDVTIVIGTVGKPRSKYV